MKNKLSDLNDHLFAQMERLGEEGLEGEKLIKEVERTKAMTIVAKDIIENSRLVLDVQKSLGDRLITQVPPMLALESK